MMMTTKIPVSLSQAFYNKDMRPNSTNDARSRSFIATDASLKVFISHLRTGNAFAVGTYEDNHRKEDNFIQSQIVALDLDSASMQTAKQKPDIANHALILHETPSHTTEKPKARVIFILDRPIPRLDAWRKAQAAVLHKFADLKPDTSCHDGARFFYGSTGDYIIQAGNRLSIGTLAEWIKEHEAHEATQLEVGPGQSVKADKQDKASKYAEKAYQNQLDKLKAATEGERNKTLIAVMLSVFEMARGAWPGITEDRVTSDCKQIGIAIGLTQKEVAATIKSAEKKATGRPLILSDKPQQQTAPPRQPEPLQNLQPSANGKATLKLSKTTIDNSRQRFNQALLEPNMIPGFKTNIHKLDLMIGGIQRGCVHTVIGETGHGKTQFAMGIAYNVMAEVPVLILSMESSEEQIHDRLFAYAAKQEGVAYGDFNKGKKLVHYDGDFTPEDYTDADLAAIRKGQAQVRRYEQSGRFHIIEDAGMATLQDLETSIKIWVKELGIGLVIWDGFGDVIIPGTAVYDRTTETMQYVERIATQNKIAIVGTSQGGRSTKGRSDHILGLQDNTGGSLVENKSEVHVSIFDPYDLKDRGIITNNELDKYITDHRGKTRIPIGHVLLRVNKIRGGSLRNNSILVRKYGGAGFYEVKGNG